MPRAQLIFPEGQDKVAIPLRRAGRLVAANVSIGGQGAGWFIVDTGASTTALDAAIADRLHLKPALDRTLRVNGAAGGQFKDAQAVFLRDLQLGSLRMPATLGVRADMGWLSSMLGSEVIGCLGNDVLGQAPFALDPREGTLTFYRPDHFTAPTNATAIDAEVTSGNALLIKGSISGFAGWFTLDTGHNSTISLTYDFVHTRRGLIPRMHQSSWQSFTGEGISQSINTDFEDVELLGEPAQELSADYWARVASTSERSNLAGTIGMSILADKRLIVDFAHGRVWVQKLDAETDEQLFQRLATQNAPDLSGATPLIQAAEAGRAGIVQRFIKGGAKVNTKARDDTTALMHALRSLECVRMLLDHGANVDDTHVMRARTTLMMAAEAGLEDVVAALLDHHAEIDKRDTEGGTH